jgi:hypothetical protein
MPAPAPVTIVSPVTATPPLPTRRKVFVANDVARGVVKVLKDEYKISGVGEATCPEDQLVTPGNSCVCGVSVEGAAKSVKVLVKSSDGEYEVDQPR